MAFRFLLGWFFLVSSAWAQHATNAPAFSEAAAGAKKFQLLPGFKLDVWAAEPQLSNSVAFAFDGRGRAFLAQSDRWAISVFDITAHTNWLWEDMSFRNVADRSAFLKREFATNLALLTKDTEVIRLVEDRDGDGKADFHANVAEGFNSVADGTAAGILASDGYLFFGNIPNLWRFPLPATAPAEPLRPQPDQLLAHGFGVHIGVSGHDLHGLIRGPDGRVYLSFGDRGACLTNREGVVINLPDMGGVLRCEPDGRNLEVFCYGLRNPQELAFDDEGNLWTVDNDTAGADPCRVLHLVKGGDYGWRTSYQHHEGFGPWVQEELWKGGKDGILPLAGVVSQGPSGLAYYPGTGMGDRLKGKFVHCDFPGGVWEFSVKPQGASYAVSSQDKLLWNCWPTDVDFGPDGGLYVLDWVSGWGQTPRGRIYRLSWGAPLEAEETRLVQEVKQLLAEGMGARSEQELLGWLGHTDRRVRWEAQWELARRGAAAVPGLVKVAGTGTSSRARIQALWGLEQLARTQALDLRPAVAPLRGLLQDGDPEVRGQAARILGELGDSSVLTTVVGLLGDPSVRTRFLAGEALVSLVIPETAGQWAALMDTPAWKTWNEATDLFLRHAAVRWIAQRSRTATDPKAPLRPGLESPEFELRLGTLWAARVLRDNFVTNFLNDPDPRLVEEAGRAVHDVPIVAGFPALASFVTKIDCPPGLHSRVINACLRLGTQQHAQMLASFAVREDIPDAARLLAVQTLALWAAPPPLDRVNGLWRPLVTAEQERSETTATPVTPVPSANPLLERAAQAARNFGRAAELPVLPADLGRSVSFAEGIAVKRNPVPARRAFLRVAGDLLNPFNLTESGVPAGTREVLALQIATAQAAAQLQVKEASSPLFERFARTNSAPELRRAILPALVTLRAGQLPEAVKLALSDADPQLRAAALPYLDQLDGGDSVALLAGLLPTSPTNAALNVPLAQAAMAVLGRTPGPAADSVLSGQLELWASGQLPAELRLDVAAAARVRSAQDPEWTARLTRVLGAPVEQSSAWFPLVQVGGQAARGRDVFWNNPTVQCLRCHKVGTDGGIVGPNLSDIGRRFPREYLLEGIVNPNARISTGFESAVVTLKNGETHAGIVKREDDRELVLEVTDGETGQTQILTLAKANVSQRERGLSAMPEGLAEQLTPFELRDVVEYLSSLK